MTTCGRLQRVTLALTQHMAFPLQIESGDKLRGDIAAEARNRGLRLHAGRYDIRF